MEESICDSTGNCIPYDCDSGTSNCIHCGKELIEVSGEWKAWDFDLTSGDSVTPNQETM